MPSPNRDVDEAQGEGASSYGIRLPADVGRIEIAGESAAMTAVDQTSDQGDAMQHALLSAFIPGAAQVAQGRWIAGVAQFGIVVAYLAGVFAVGPKQALWLALFWHAYSALEAYWYMRE